MRVDDEGNKEVMLKVILRARWVVGRAEGISGGVVCVGRACGSVDASAWICSTVDPCEMMPASAGARPVFSLVGLPFWAETGCFLSRPEISHTEIGWTSLDWGAAST